MVELIRAIDYQVMPWKNGGGQTAEIGIFPQGATVAAHDFFWRLSSATIEKAGPFSIFPGCERILSIWKGEGLILNGVRHESHSPFAFSGEIPLDCIPIGDKVTDIGIIYRRDKVKVEVTTKILIAKPGPQSMSLSEGTHFLVCTKGSFTSTEIQVAEGDSLKITGAQKLNYESPKGAEILHLLIL